MITLPTTQRKSSPPSMHSFVSNVKELTSGGVACVQRVTQGNTLQHLSNITWFINSEGTWLCRYALHYGRRWAEAVAAVHLMDRQGQLKHAIDPPQPCQTQSRGGGGTISKEDECPPCCVMNPLHDSRIRAHCLFLHFRGFAAHFRILAVTFKSVK